MTDLHDLQKDIAAAKQATKPHAKSSSEKEAKSMSAGARAGTELVGGIMGGLFFGYLIDQQFATGPWGVVIGVTLGIIAGFYGVYRASK